jgi:hypothetical protein
LYVSNIESGHYWKERQNRCAEFRDNRYQCFIGNRSNERTSFNRDKRHGGNVASTRVRFSDRRGRWRFGKHISKSYSHSIGWTEIGHDNGFCFGGNSALIWTSIDSYKFNDCDLASTGLWLTYGRGNGRFGWFVSRTDGYASASIEVRNDDGRRGIRNSSNGRSSFNSNGRIGGNVAESYDRLGNGNKRNERTSCSLHRRRQER